MEADERANALFHQDHDTGEDAGGSRSKGFSPRALRQDFTIEALLTRLWKARRTSGYSVAREYVDEAESGRIADRPQFRQMIDEGGKNNAPFQAILV